MNRREALQKAALLTGIAVSGSVTSAILQGCQAEHIPNYEPVFFTKEQMKEIAAMAETILPNTADSPGAIDVGVPEFIDIIANDTLKPEQQEKAKAGIDAMIEAGKTENGKLFSQLSAEDQLTYLTKVDQAAKSEGGNSYYLQMKQLVILGYYTSEAVGTEVLAYDPIPGAYVGCVDLSENGGIVWSL